jgi:DNA modification methylase
VLTTQKPSYLTVFAWFTRFGRRQCEVVAVIESVFHGRVSRYLRNPKYVYVKDASIDLCYIDPPFNSKRRYNQIYTNIGYEDRAQAQAFIDIHTWDEQAIDCFQQIITNDGSRYTEQTIELIKGFRNVLKEGPLLAYIVSMTARIVEINRVLKKEREFLSAL